MRICSQRASTWLITPFVAHASPDLCGWDRSSQSLKGARSGNASEFRALTIAVQEYSGINPANVDLVGFVKA
jgi:hypothetical protein